MVYCEEFLLVILLAANVRGDQDQCTIGLMRGRCDCNKYEVCLSGQWEEATVPNNEKYVTICGNCTADDTRNGCSNSQREVSCGYTALSSSANTETSHMTYSIASDVTSEISSAPEILVSQTATEFATVTDPGDPVMCPCSCEFQDQIAHWENSGSQPEAEEVLVSKINEMKKELQVNITELTSTKLKKISAPDSRTSAAVAGYIGVIFIVIVFGSIVALDLSTLVVQIGVFCKRLKGQSKEDIVW